MSWESTEQGYGLGRSRTLADLVHQQAWKAWKEIVHASVEGCNKSKKCQNCAHLDLRSRGCMYWKDDFTFGSFASKLRLADFNTYKYSQY